MHNANVSDHVRPLLDAFLRVSNEDHRGTRLADENHFPPQKPPQNTTLKPRIYKLFIDLINAFPSLVRSSFLTAIGPNVLELEKISISGVIYAREKSLPRDSNIIFRRGRSSDRVGRIKQIFQSQDVVDGVTFLAVVEHELIADPIPQGVYGRFGFAGGYLCDPSVNDRQYVIKTSDVVCHFARTALVWEGKTLMHVLPLNSVRHRHGSPPSSCPEKAHDMQKMIDYQVPMEYTLPEH